MVEIQPKLPEKEIITPQPFDILVQVAKKPDGTATIIPLKESVQEVARWMDTYDRRMNISDYPYQSFGDVVICDGNMRPLSRLPLGLLNNYLRNKEGRTADWLRDTFGNPSPTTYGNMILSELNKSHIINGINRGYSQYLSKESTKNETLEKRSIVLETKKELKQEQTEITAQKIKSEAEAKASKWTEQDLIKLLATVKVNNAVTLPDLIKKSIEDPRRGNPEEFAADLVRIRDMFTIDGIMIDGKKKEILQPEAQDFLLAAFFSYHLDTMGYIRELDESGQVVIHAIKPANAENAKKLTEKMQNSAQIFTAIDRDWTKKGDNVSRFAHSVAVSAYYNPGSGKDLMTFLADTRKKAGLGPMASIAPTDLEKKGPEYDQYKKLTDVEKKTILEEAKKGKINASEATMMLAWNNSETIKELIPIQKEQSEWVEKSVENWNKKSPREQRKEMLEHPITGNIGTILTASIGGAALYYGVTMLFGPKAKWYQRILALPLLMIGVPLGGGMIEKGLGAIGMKDALVNAFAGGQIIDASEARDGIVLNTMASISGSDLYKKGGESITAGWNRLTCGVFDNPTDIAPVMDFVSGDNMKAVRGEYSVNDMLYVLSDDKDRGGLQKPDGAIITKITETFANEKDADKKTKFTAVLRDSWKKFTENHVTGKTLPMTPDELRKQKLPDVIADLDEHTGWKKYTNLGWLGIGTSSEQLIAMKEMLPRADKWMDFTVADMKKYFVDSINNSSIRAQLDANHTKATTQAAKIKAYIEKIPTSDDSKTLQEVIGK